MRRLSLLLSMVTLCGASTTALADSSSSKAVAEALFRDGTQLLASGDVQAACPKFEDSMKVDPALGTLLYLAACHEKEGRTASAWSEFTSARAWAERTEQHDRAAFAQKRVAALEERLSNIVITAPAIAGLELKLDDGALTSASLGSALPVDPGNHTITAEAPDRQPWHVVVKVPAEPGRTDVEIPALAPLPAAPAAVAAPTPHAVAPPLDTPPPVATGGPSTGARAAMWTALGFTAVGVGVGTWFGVLTLQEADTAKKLCPGNLCQPGGLDHISRARTDSIVSTVGFSVAGAAAVVAGYFVFKRYDHPAAPAGASLPKVVAVAPALAPNAAGLVMVGEFE